MKNRFEITKKIDDYKQILLIAGYSELPAVINLENLEEEDVSLFIDNEIQSFYLISDNIINTQKDKIKELYNKTLYDIDFKAPKTSKIFDKKDRDEFAIAAMKGELSSQSQEFTWDPEKLAVRCYAIADEMIKARNNKK